MIRLEKQDEFRLAVRFPFNRAYVDAIKAIPGKAWEPEHLRWTIPYTLNALMAFKERFPRDAVKIDETLSAECPTLDEW